MKLIFAQGNPGDTYATTRHNVGFLIADAFTGDSSYKNTAKFFADIAEVNQAGEKVLVVKPSTFYNETGRSFLALKQFYKLENEDLLVIHDELALPFGTLRTRVGGSDAGNNGIKSINSAGGDTTARLRVGISNDLRARIADTDFVLGKFSKEEQSVLEQTIIPKSIEIIRQFIIGEFAVTNHAEIDNDSARL